MGYLIVEMQHGILKSLMWSNTENNTHAPQLSHFTRKYVFHVFIFPPWSLYFVLVYLWLAKLILSL